MTKKRILEILKKKDWLNWDYSKVNYSKTQLIQIAKDQGIELK